MDNSLLFSLIIPGLIILMLILEWEDRYRPFRKFKDGEELLETFIELQRVKKRQGCEK
jgi:hypothetical protein